MLPIRRLTVSNPALSPISAREQLRGLLERVDLVRRQHRQRGILAPAGPRPPPRTRRSCWRGEPPYAPRPRRLERIEQAERLGAEVLDRVGQVVAGRREVHDAGDLVPLADVEERRLVRGVQRLDDDPAVGLAGEVLGQVGGPVRGEHDRFAQVEQCPCGVRPDRAQAAGDENHCATPPSADGMRSLAKSSRPAQRGRTEILAIRVCG